MAVGTTFAGPGTDIADMAVIVPAGMVTSSTVITANIMAIGTVVAVHAMTFRFCGRNNKYDKDEKPYNHGFQRISSGLLDKKPAPEGASRRFDKPRIDGHGAFKPELWT